MDAAVFDRYRDAWNNHDVDAVLEFFTDDGVYEDVTVARVNRGKAEIRAFVEPQALFAAWRLGGRVRGRQDQAELRLLEHGGVPRPGRDPATAPVGLSSRPEVLSATQGPPS
jgi:ketosteroid isomerase-like protein